MITFDSVVLKKHLKRALACVSTDQDYRSCIMFDGPNGKIVATDGYVMYIGETIVFPERLLIHHEILKQVEKQLDFKKHFIVEWDGDRITYLALSIQAKNQIDKTKYPNYPEIMGLYTQDGEQITKRTFDTKVFSRVLSSLSFPDFELKFCPQPQDSENVSPCYIHIHDTEAPGMFVVMPMEEK